MRGKKATGRLRRSNPYWEAEAPAAHYVGSGSTYYPTSEELGEDEMRITFVGSLPVPADAMTEQPRAKDPGDGMRRLAAITVATSLLVWWPAFTLGVYGEIFFEQLFALWAAATAAFLVAMLLLGRHAQPAVYSLLLPSVWIVLTWLTPADTTSLEHDVLVWFGVLVTLAGLPAMVALVLVTVVPDVESVTSRRDNFVAIGAVALVVVLSYTLGTQHPHLLTCEDFTISGNSEPAGCTPDTGVIGLPDP